MFDGLRPPLISTDILILKLLCNPPYGQTNGLTANHKFCANSLGTSPGNAWICDCPFPKLIVQNILVIEPGLAAAMKSFS